MPPPVESPLPASVQQSFYSRPTTGHPRSATFNEHSDNLHRVEFEAPLSADADAATGHSPRGHGARFSIDYSLELERQLAMESPPQTPTFSETKHTTTATTAAASAHGFSPRSDSLANELAPDPDVLAHIITQLRQSVADITKERDELVTMLTTAHAEQANTTDALQAMTDKATAAEEELSALRRKSKEDEDQIVLLRAKVEESRRGLMRLQTENRRQSMAPIDISRASAGTFASFTSPPSSKRASFVPLTGSGKSSSHRRNGSVNDAGLGSFPTPDQSPSPNMRAFNIASAEASLSGAPSSSRRFSGMFGRQPSPADGDVAQSAALAAEASANALELETLRKELQVIKDELDTVKHELGEAKEAKEASETCVTALREFIADNNVGVAGPSTGFKLPPPPSMATGEETSLESKKTGSGWGFKLWGNAAPDSSSKHHANAPHSASPAASSPMTTAAMPPSSATIAAPPLSRKIGGFFTSRSTSISSNASNQPLHLQTNAAATQLPSQRDSIYSHSDVSSIAEPISPGSDMNSLGPASYPQFKPRGIHLEEAAVKDSNSVEANSTHVSMSDPDMELLR